MEYVDLIADLAGDKKLTKNVTQISHNELIECCAQNRHDQRVWTEFYNRYHNHIRLQILRECYRQRLTHSLPDLRQFFEDLVQDVYVRLIDKNCQALFNFHGNEENSIFLYLGVIARRCVINYVAKMSAQKRPIIDKSIDQPVGHSENHAAIPLKELVKDPDVDIENLVLEKEEIIAHLNNIISGKNKARDLLIYKLYIKGYSPEDIAEKYNVGVSAKRISNIIGKLKQKLQISLIM